jgi:protein-L-isoaspartate(D-aspartate) O-methyltransferase
MVATIVTAFQNQHDMRGAWKSAGKNQRELVEQLRKKGIIRTDAVQNIMGVVDRGNYCDLSPRFESSESDTHLCYSDRALGIGLGQTISAPHMHAYALEELYPSVELATATNKKNAKILDVGCGSGYLTACFGRWLSPPLDESSSDKISGRVFGIDVRRDLVDMTRKNLERADGDLLVDGVVDLSLQDGWKGLPEHAPFDAIHVGAAASTLPKILCNQLSVGGVMVIPIGPQDSSKHHQVLYKIKRIRGRDGADDSGAGEEEDYYSSEEAFNESDFEIKSLLGVRYVPLVRGEEL